MKGSWILMVLAAAGGGVTLQAQRVERTVQNIPPPMLISACEDPADWEGGTAETDIVKEGQGAIRWEHAEAAALSLKNPPQDWSAHNCLNMELYSVKATGSSFIVYMGSENPDSEGIDYYSRTITLDFTGWKSFQFRTDTLGGVRSPLGWDQITSFRFNASGWGHTPHPDAVVIVDNIRLTWEPPITGPRLSDEEFFAAMDLDLPALAEVNAAVQRGDYEAAKAAFVEHLKTRERPLWHVDWRDRPRHEARPEGVNTDAADKIAAHILTSCGIPYDFGDDIDWSINPTELKYKEWTWQLSRHPFWRTLGRAYWATGDEKYAKDFVYQMTDWVMDNPVPVNDHGNRAGSRWRTIETGIRMFASWPDSFFYFLSSPSFDDESVIMMVKSMVEHAHHLMAHPTRNNWLAMEMNGLFHVGVLFPEFKAAATWRETASGRLYEEMNKQVYPDGAQVELATGYHGVSLHNFLGTLRLASLNDISLPGDYTQRLEKMYNYYLKLAMPDGRMPALNDAGWGSVQGALRQGFELFPERTDFEFLASAGHRGTKPDYTSTHFTHAGWGVMRNGWRPDDLYMHFEYGPFGAGHQHEDKLSIIVHAFGERLLTEAGVYAYDSSQWRRYVLSTRAHNTIMVDGMEQNRRGLSETYLTEDPLPNRWMSTPEFDFAEGWFDEGYGRERDRTVTHRRAVLFIKPDYWLVVDRLSPSDDAQHRYDVLFHFNEEASRPGPLPGSVLSGDGDGPSLAIVPLNPDAVSLEVVSGQEEPTVQGWVPAGGYEVRPVATPIYTAEQAGGTILPWLLLPLQAGADLPVNSIEVTEQDGHRVYTLAFDDGRIHELRVPIATPAEHTTGALQWVEKRGSDIDRTIAVGE